MANTADDRGVLARARAAAGSGLGRATLLVFGCTALGRVVSLGKEVLVASLFGVGGSLDAYVLGLLLPQFLATLLGTVFASALIPELGAAGAQRREGLRGAALLFQAALVALAAAGLWLVPARALGLFAPGLSPERLEFVRALQLWCLPLMVFYSLGHSLASLANARGDFARPALASLVNILVVLGCIALLHGRLGVVALAVAVGAGAAVEFALLAWASRGLWPELRLAARRMRAGGLAAELAGVAGLLRGWGLLALGASLMGLAPFVDNAIASSLGEGAVSVLNYGSRLPMGLAGLLGLTVSTVLLPHFTRLANAGAPAELRAACRGMALRLLLFAGPLALACALASPLLTRALYQGGNFDARAALAVSEAQAWYFARLPFYLVGLGVTRVLQALMRQRFLLILQGALLCVGAAASLGLSRMLGVAGVAASAALVQALFAGAGLWAALRTGRGPQRADQP